MHINLYAKVGRAPRQCVGTFDVNEKQSLDAAQALAVHSQAAHLHARIAEGVSPDRVSYEQETVGAPIAKKGKK